jgi:beta-glucanase (GH16 family)
MEMYVEMRAKLPYGIGAWPAFWLNAGVQYDNDKFSDWPWPPEIDIFEFFNWRGRNQTRAMTGYVQSHNKLETFGADESQWNYAIDYVRVWRRPDEPSAPDEIKAR